jgi:hypothetical protein
MNNAKTVNKLYFGQLTGYIMISMLDIIVKDLNDRGIDILLIGGHALPAYGVVRQTVDTDFLVAEDDIESVTDIFTARGYIKKEQTSLFVRYISDDSGDFDLLMVDRQTFQSIYDESVKYFIASVEVNIPNMSCLIALKLHAIKNNSKRELKDLFDIVELLRINPDKISPEELQYLCVNYGPADIDKKLEHYR